MIMQKKIWLPLALATLAGAAALWAFAYQAKMPIRQSVLQTRQYGDISVAKPWFSSQGLVLVFADSKRFAPAQLAKDLASTGAAVAVVDAATAVQTFSDQGRHCLDAERITGPLQALETWAGTNAGRKIIAGIGDGGLLPLLASTGKSVAVNGYLSIGFSAVVPKVTLICPPFTVNTNKDKQAVLAAPAGLKIHWRSVWTDYPPNDTAVFVRTLPTAETAIAPYDTPLDVVALKEIGTLLGQQDAAAPNLPIVEVPTDKANPTLTLFYSGDGGWRDLDRTVAEEMAKLGYPVAGVDVLRYFWERKSPEQSAADLAETLAFYRKTWGATSFVLAGYSFGADILPAVFNRLSPEDQASIPLLVLLAPAEQANFEIHVSGWLGNDGGEQPLAPELARIAKNKILCVYGQEEKDERGCASLANSQADILELPGGHHFDQDYPKLARQILDAYHAHGIK